MLAVARGMIPEENMVYDAEELMKEVVQSTHYMPVEWKDQLHSQKVDLWVDLFKMILLSLILGSTLR